MTQGSSAIWRSFSLRMRDTAWARAALYEKFHPHDLPETWEVATSVIEIDGIDGLLYVLEAIGAVPVALDFVTTRLLNPHHR